MAINYGVCNLVEVEGAQEDVFRTAYNHHIANGKEMLIGNLGAQGSRAVFATALTSDQFLAYTVQNPLKSSKGADYVRASDFHQVTQRALDAPHLKEITSYLRGNANGDHLILPGIALNCADQDIVLFVHKGTAPMRFAVLCLDKYTPLEVIDGMHRKLALEEVLNPKQAASALAPESARMFRNLMHSVLVTFEANHDQLKHDFATIATAKPIPPGVQFAFRANMINDFTGAILRKVPFLAYHTNVGAKQTVPKSAHAWTYSTVSRAIRRSVAGVRTDDEHRLTEDLELLRKTPKARPQDLDFEEFLERWWLAVQDAFPVYSKMAAMPKAPDNFMAALREEGDGTDNMILLSVTGLELFGQLAHDLWKHGWRAQNDIALRIAFLKSYNWSAHNPDWLTNVIPFKGESVTRRPSWLLRRARRSSPSATRPSIAL